MSRPTCLCWRSLSMTCGPAARRPRISVTSLRARRWRSRSVTRARRRPSPACGLPANTRRRPESGGRCWSSSSRRLSRTTARHRCQRSTGVSPCSTVPGSTVPGSTVPGSTVPGRCRGRGAADVRQHPALPPADVARLAAADLAELAASQHDVALVLSAALAAVWTAPAAGRVRVMPPGQPSTEVWWGLIDELTGDADPVAPADLLVVADYDPHLRYLCLTAFDTGSRLS